MGRQVLERVAALAAVSTRAEAATALAEHLGAEALFVFTSDAELNDALVPAAGFPAPALGGAAWLDLLTRCQAPGVHRGEVALPPAVTSPAVALVSPRGLAFVLVGGEVADEHLADVEAVLPLLEELLQAEQLATAAHGRTQEALRVKDEMLAMLGHELRNPLAPILTALQVMRLEGKASREQDILERQVAHLRRLVDDLLDVSSIARGKVDLRREVVEICDVAAHAIETASPLLEQKRQVLTVDIPDSGLPVEADPMRLAQVFANLLTNAAKYSDAEASISFVATRDGDVLRIRVQDNGIGIDPEMCERIFDQFVQSQQASNRAAGGLGLGLAIVRGIVTMHGGTVTVISEGSGKGSQFVVELPLASTPAVRPARRKPATMPPAEGEAAAVTTRILVVDDNEDAALLLAEALESFGYVVLTAADGPSALRAAVDFAPEIALLDIGLPAMDGYELARRLRAMASGKAVRMVAITGYGQATDRLKSQQAGFEAHLVKPVDLSDLRRLLATMTTGAGSSLKR